MRIWRKDGAKPSDESDLQGGASTILHNNSWQPASQTLIPEN